MPRATEKSADPGRLPLEEHARPSSPGGSEGWQQNAAADYVLEISKQLSAISVGAGLELLAYLLDMVSIEAQLVKTRTEPKIAPP